MFIYLSIYIYIYLRDKLIQTNTIYLYIYTCLGETSVITVHRSVQFCLFS